MVTDCNTIRTTWTKRDLVPRIERWWLAIQEFDYTVEYRPGTRMAQVDSLSRNPIESDEQNVGALQININDSDWILTIQLQDTYCKYLHDVLTRKPDQRGKIYS